MTLKHQQGFGYIAAIVIVVVLALLGAAAARLSTTQQTSASQDLQSSRAWQTARAGTEWGLYRALHNDTCFGDTTLDMRGENGFAVTVTCSAFTYAEGQYDADTDPDDEVTNLQPLNKTVYTITATACNAASCPDNGQAATLGYTERRRVVTSCAHAAGMPTAGSAC